MKIVYRSNKDFREGKPVSDEVCYIIDVIINLS